MVISNSKRRKGIAKIFDAILASILLVTVVSVASIHIARTNHISTDTELELAASSVDEVVQDYERTGLLYYYVNQSDIQDLYTVLHNIVKSETNFIQLNVTLEKMDENGLTIIASAGPPIKDYVELTYFLSIKNNSKDNFYVLKVMVGYAEG